jgi:hypothetical protein
MPLGDAEAVEQISVFYGNCDVIGDLYSFFPSPLWTGYAHCEFMLIVFRPITATELTLNAERVSRGRNAFPIYYRNAESNLAG